MPWARPSTRSGTARSSTSLAGRSGSCSPSPRSAPASRRSRICAPASSPCMAPTTASTVPRGSPASPTRPGRRRRTAGRVLLAGDAAHIHSPMGGQGLNLGVQDAVNLGWKLAQVVKGISPDSLLDTYHAERHPIGARVLRTTMAQVALTRVDDRTEALRDSVAELLAMDEPRRRFAAMLSGLDISYDLGEGHPLLGRRMPDLDLMTDAGPTRVFRLLHDARPVLLELGSPGAGAWRHRCRDVGRSRPPGARRDRRSLGPARPWHGARADRGPDPARRPRGLGRRGLDARRASTTRSRPGSDRRRAADRRPALPHSPCTVSAPA